MNTASNDVLAAHLSEHAAMLRAVRLAEGALGCTSPNPIVGAVVLNAAGQVVGEGRHDRAGQPHAEVSALRAAGDRARGGTVVVTLEPCTHTGRTGPCVASLLSAGVHRVVVGVRDPYPPAAGGIEQLRAAGVEVVVGVAEAEVRWSNRAWLIAMQRQRPYLTWKFAATLDGRSAAADGSSRWITGEAARADVHRLRACHDAVMVGIGTVLADDPELTVRLPDHDGRGGFDEVHRPLRVVVDSTGRTPPQARVRQPQTPRSGVADTWIATASEVGGTEVGGADGRVDLTKLLAELFARGCRSVLLEGGPTLAGAALEAGLVDEVVAYIAPALLGAGAPALAGAGIHTISQALRLEVRDVQLIDTDVRIVGTLAAQNHRLKTANKG